MLGRIVVVAVSLAFSAAAAAGAGDPFPNFLNLAHFGPAVSGPMDEILAKCAEYNIANEMMEALPYSEALVRMDPGNAMHHYHLARNYLLLNQLAGALFHYNWALQIDQYHTQSEIGTANVGHISKILNVDMVCILESIIAAFECPLLPFCTSIDI
jgi:hypothetical protein